jgi:large subunit ribosomal protein L6
MSRIGNAPITIPAGVTVELKDGGNFHYLEVIVNGPKGTLSESVRRPITLEVKDGEVLVSRPNNEKQNRSYHGLYRSLIANMVQGVTEGYKRELEIIGIGYRAEQQGEQVVFSLGYAHKINLVPPAGVTITIQDQTKIAVEGVDKQKVGQTAAKIRSFRPPEPYKGKGIRYSDEQVHRKSVKQATA